MLFVFGLIISIGLSIVIFLDNMPQKTSLYEVNRANRVVLVEKNAGSTYLNASLVSTLVLIISFLILYLSRETAFYLFLGKKFLHSDS